MMNVGFDWKEGLYQSRKPGQGSGQGTRERIYCKAGTHYTTPEEPVIWLSRPLGLSCVPCAERHDPEAVAAERARREAERAAAKTATAARTVAPKPRAPRPRKTNKLPPEQWKHGTRSTYLSHGCRCDECRAANTQWSRDLRERKRRGEHVAPRQLADGERPILAGNRKHGSAHTYGLGCRCQPCTEAKAEKVRRERSGVNP